MKSESSHSDHVLMHRLRSGTDVEAAEALEILVTRHYMALSRFAVSKVGSPDLADDILQDVFFRLWRRRQQITPSSSVIAYLFAATRNTILDTEASESSRRRREIMSTTHLPNVHDDVGANFEQNEMERLVSDAVAGLPVRCREVFELVRKNGLTYSEAATTLGVSLSTVKTQMARAMSALVQKLGTLALLMVWVSK